MASDQQYLDLIASLSTELDKRAGSAQVLDRYYDGDHPYPEPVRTLKVTQAYSRLMSMAQANWPKLVVDSVDERLQVNGIRFADRVMDTNAWDAWQRNNLDLGSGLIHRQALTNGRSYVLVWPKQGGGVTITPEHQSQMIVSYVEGSLWDRAAAMRRWTDGKRWYATLYLPSGIYKFRSKKEGAEVAIATSGAPAWERREVEDEQWPLPNPSKVVPVVEFMANPRLRPSGFGPWGAMGEFEDQTGHIDRINFTVFSWLVAMVSLGFDLHALIGDPITYDDNDEPIAPFERTADRVVQIENPNGKLVQLAGQDLTSFEKSTDAFIRHLAAITKTPAHYLLGQLVNVSADAIRAAEAGLISKVNGIHKLSFGESWEEVLRLALKMGDEEGADDPAAEIIWGSIESRSLAERADAASKLKDILPWQALTEKVLDLTPQEVSRYESMRSSDTLTALMPAALAGGNGQPSMPAGPMPSA